MTGGHPCRGKQAHADRAAAQAALDRLLANDPRHSTRMNVYACPVCSSWHVGHARGMGADIARAVKDGRRRRTRSRRNRR